MGGTLLLGRNGAAATVGRVETRAARVTEHAWSGVTPGVTRELPVNTGRVPKKGSWMDQTGFTAMILVNKQTKSDFSGSQHHYIYVYHSRPV